MLITPHAVTGAAIATQINNPLSVFISLGSHFILDKIPHWQETLPPYKPTNKTWLRIVIDLLIALIFVNLVTLRHPQNDGLILINAFMANVPDLDVFCLVWKRIMEISLFRSFYKWHCKIQRETSSYWGIITQLIVIVIGLKISL